jgi:hypothetical protein
VENDLGEHRPVIIITGCVAIIGGLVLVWIFGLGGPDEMAYPVANLSEITDSAVIQNHVHLSRISIATGENYFGHKVRLIYGVLKNVSDKPLRAVDVRMVFTDYDGNPIQESVQKAFENHNKPLTPGNEYRFEVGFENLPANWNYRVPITNVVKIAY